MAKKRNCQNKSVSIEEMIVDSNKDFEHVQMTQLTEAYHHDFAMPND